MQLLDDAISGNEMQVDVLSVIPGTGATDLGKADDAAHAENDVGVMPLAVRTDSGISLVDTDGDYSPLQVDNTGRLRVNSGGSGGSATEYAEDTAHVPGDAGTMPLAVRKDVAGSLVNADNDYSPLQVDEDGKLRVTSSGSGGSATEYTEDAATPGTIVGTTSMMERDDVLTTGVAEADWAAFKCNVNGALWVGVDGTVALSDTDNAVLDSIAATNTDIKTAVEAAIDGNEMQVDVVSLPSLPAGDANIGNVDVVSLPSLPAGDANIGNVDVVSVIPGTGATNLGKAEDSVHADGDVGVMPLAVRNDTAATLVNADGDYAPLQVDEDGKLWVTSSGSGGSATEYDEDSVHADGDAGIMPLAVRQDIGGTLASHTGDYTPLQTDNAGNLRIVNGEPFRTRDDAPHVSQDYGVMSLAVRNDTGGNMVTLDGDYAPLQLDGSGNLRATLASGTNNIGDVDIASALPAGDNNIGNVDIVTLPALVAGSANIGTVGLVAGTESIGTVSLSDTDNAVLDSIDTSAAAIKTAVETLDNAITDNEMQVDVVSLPAVELSATDNAVLDSIASTNTDIKTAVEVLDNAISGSEMQVDVVTLPELPTGSNSIGTVSLSETDNAVLDSIASTNTDIKTALDNAISGNEMQVDVISVNPGSSNTSLGKSASNAHSTTNYGVMSLAVRRDADTTFESTADGDYSPLQTDADGKLKVSATLAASTNNIGDVDVLSLPALPAGDNNIGNVDVASALPAGDNNIGNVDVLSLPALPAGDNNIGNVDVASALPAGDNNIGNVDIVTLPSLVAGSANIGDVDIDSASATSSNMGAALMTNVIHDGVTALTPKFAKIDAASSGDNTLVAIVSGKKIRVLSLFMISAGTVTARLESTNSSGTLLTGQMNLVVNSGFTLPFNPVGWFETAAGELLNLELSGAVSVDGCLVYVEV